MIASLPMYDRPETRAAHDRLWALFRSVSGINTPSAPEHLTRDVVLPDHWITPDLVLSQTCSLPYRTELRDKVTLLATPVHGLPCPEGYYYSVIVARTDDPRTDFTDFGGGTMAFNSANSQSGWAAPMTMAAQHGVVFGKAQETGAHQASARAVFEKTADLAAIDAVTWTLMKRYETWTDGLKELATTPPTPALPYICLLYTSPSPRDS